MKILYGVGGEGMGHAMRSRVVLDHLVARHDVQVVVSGRAYDYLAARASEHLAVRQIWGYSLVYEDKRGAEVAHAQTEPRGRRHGLAEDIRAYVEIAERFEPDVVISDFETWSYLFARRHRCAHPPEILAGVEDEFRLTKAIVKAKVAGAAHYHITTFFYPPTRKDRTSLHPPIYAPRF